VAKAQADLVAIREGIGDGARDQYLDHALQILKTLALGLGTPQFTEEQVKLLVHKAGRLLSHATRTGAAELLAELKASQKKLEAVMAARDTAIEHHTNVSISGRSLEIDMTHQEAELARLGSRATELADELAPLQSSSARLPRLKAAHQAAEKLLVQASERLEAGRRELSALNDSIGGGAARSQVLVALERAKAQAAQLSENQAAAAAARASAVAAEAAAEEQAAAWGLKPSDLPVASTSQDLSALSDQLARAEALLEARTQMYQEQLGEYEAVTQRQSDLVTQIADLEAAEADLTKLVSELDTLIRARFKENFQALAEQFSLYFARLFEGGSASLELSESDTGDYGVTIKASPKGKRLTGIAALSGGERALAGVALVAAIMKVNPSPFVVLDEIDAALDEANSGRLAGILTELQQYSQLIVITHNRQTMQAAQVLFGVTLGDNHVSSLISMRLEQATQLAAR
jgi:chromosome segregation protein